MNKRVNTLLFILGATVINILLVVLCFLALTSLYLKFLMPSIPEENRLWAFPIFFLASIALSFIIYRLIIKYLLKKIDVNKYFDPLFARRNLKRD